MNPARTTAPSPVMVSEAAEAVYRAWRKHVGESEARAEARAFASRFVILIDGPLKPLTHLDDLISAQRKLLWMLPEAEREQKLGEVRADYVYEQQLDGVAGEMGHPHGI